MIDVTVGVKPVFGPLIHSGAWEGPCRTGNLTDLTPEAEKTAAQQRFSQLKQELEENLTAEATMLEPVMIQYGEDLVISPREFEKLETDLPETDLYVVSGTSIPQYFAVTIGERYKKPVATVSAGVANVDVAAYLRSRGLEGFAPLDFDELNQLISLLRVRKTFQRTKMLLIADEELIPQGVVSSIWNLEDLKTRFSIGSKRISFTRLSEQFERVTESETERQKAQQIVDKLVSNAQELRIDREYVINDVNFYLAVNNLMEKYQCNAVTVPCFELCSAQLPAKWKAVPCLTHTLLKDAGYPSSCEGDISVLLAMVLLMSVSQKSSFMGNPSLDKDLLTVTHSVPGLKMNGFDSPDLPYHLASFTAAGWGTKVQIDLADNEEKQVTLARFNPLATRILVATGTIVDCTFNEIACSPRAYIQVPDARGLIHKQVDFGHHLAMVYGDYTAQLEKLGELLDIEVEVV